MRIEELIDMKKSTHLVSEVLRVDEKNCFFRYTILKRP